MTLFQQLLERRLQDFRISKVTRKHLNKRINDGRAGIQLRDVQLNYPTNLILIFDAESTYGDDTKVGPSGQEWHDQNDYEVVIKFNNLTKYITADFRKITNSQRELELEYLFRNCDDVQTSCNCGAHYWQSVSEKGSKIPRPNSEVYPFAGVYGKDIWARIHHNMKGDKVCKHVFQAIMEIYNFIPDIVKRLGRNRRSIGNTQPVNKIKPTQPAGTPKNNKQLKTTKVKVEPPEAVEEEEEVSEPISSQKTTKEELLGHPQKGNMTNVKARKIKSKNSAAAGENNIEPAIEEPELTPESEQHADEIEEKNDQDLDELTESIVSPISSNCGHLRLQFENTTARDILYKQSIIDFPMTFEYINDRHYDQIEEIIWMEIIEPQNGFVVGLVALWPNRILPNSINISTLEINSAYRGLGFGRDSMLELIDFFTEMDIKSITLQIREPELYNFYNKFGFKSSSYNGLEYLRLYL